MATTKTDEGLKRVIGVPGLALAIVNNVIGAGIFALPAIVSIAMGAFGVIGYIFCSIMLAAIMLCYAEIGSRHYNQRRLVCLCRSRIRRFSRLYY